LAQVGIVQSDDFCLAPETDQTSVVFDERLAAQHTVGQR
jgi:hypothetical protein